MKLRWTILPLLFAIACSSTEEDEEDGGSVDKDYPDRVKELIRDRRIDIDFDKEMVRRAWGRPSRTDSLMNDERWMYTRLVFRTVERERDKAEYEKERLIYEARVATGERVKEPLPTETLHQYRTQVWRSCTFRDGKVIRFEKPTDEFVDNWQNS
jgi:ketosteroid isomerase-like protein